MALSPKSNSKIWLTFIIILIVVGAAIFWSFQSYKKLNNSIDSLTEPDHKSALIQNTIQGIIKAEKHIQSYILTNDPNIYQNYRDEINNVLSNIDNLEQEMSEDSLQVQRVKSLERLFLQKLSYLDDFLKEKRAAQYRVFSSQALEKIEETTADSALTESQVLTKLKTTEKTKPVLKQDVVETEYKAPGLWEGVKRLFGAKNIRVDTITRISNDTVTTTEIVIDTLQVVDYNPDTMLLKVKKVLQEVANQEYNKRRLLSSKELNLLQQDLKLSEEIDRIISQLQVHERKNGARRRAESYDVTRSSTQIVLAFGLIGISVGGIFLFAIGRDLTRSRYLSKRLEEEKNKANQLAKMKEEFLANMSHEIRTPLNSILGFSNLIKQTSLNNQQKEYSVALDENTRYLTGLINDILDFSKLESSNIELHPTPFYMPDLVENLQSLFALQCAEKGLELKLEFDHKLQEVDLIGDEFRLKQVLTNLLSNAVKFTKDGGIHLTIDTKERAGQHQLTIKVRDTGKGIDPSKFKHIFNAFEQEDSSVTREFGGTGLGLAIVKKLTDAMGGKITVDSKAGEFTEFKLRLNLDYQSHKASAKNSEKQAANNSFQGHVVVVEDDYWNKTLLKTVISPQVEKVSLFESASDALDFILKNRTSIDLVLTDISMPEFSGVDLLNHLQDAQVSTPVVAITAHAMPEKLKQFNELGFKAIITKPFNEGGIRAVLQDFLTEKEQDQMSNNQEPYVFNFERVKQFAGEDKSLLDDLVRSLIDNNSQNLNLFEKHLEEKNRTLLSDMAHKMIQTYDSLQLNQVVEHLKSIEVYHELGKPERMLEEANSLLPELKSIHLQLLSIRP
ncbi:MAG: response regulator [Roseivirga sp.]|uniref:ATP-binding protein n=1 Tax=Roseivirga sp. TaxID=1964215 RepID=UPI001B0A0CF1|nr:ATP-binding protein [Roseivirga sp.]MBO6660454.1 response regulator [Roseivirga sp.]MBO6761284.1 response regulator [Roseivirga sp.]MBO6906809.1 response regulator [Roseivirga sp.]